MYQEYAGAYLATHVSQNFGVDTPKKETTPKWKYFRLTEIVKLTVYISEIDSAESKSCIILGIGLLLHCSQNLVCQIVDQIRPWE